MLNLTKNKVWISLITITVLIGMGLRLYKWQTPLADWHSWRQADTASVANEYVKHGINLFVPTYHDISTIPSGLKNPQGYRMVEFPVINAFVAIIYQILNLNSALPIHQLYRIINAIFSIFSGILIFQIMKKEESKLLGWLSMMVFYLLPFNIYYSRSILPEVPMVFFSLLTIWFAKKVFENHHIYPIIGLIISASIALLIKPVAAFFMIPLIPLIVKSRSQPKKLLIWFISLIVSMLPLVLWRGWITQFPEGIPASSWLLNGNNIRFKGAFFYWLFSDRIGRLILGEWDIALLTMGIISCKKSSFIGWYTLGSLLYLMIFATGNVQHDYYQIPIIPAVAILVAYGLRWLVTYPKINLISASLIALILTLFMLGFSWYHVRGFYNINNPAIVKAGQAVDLLVPQNALVIAPYNGDTAFLYQTNRRGWPIGGDIEQKITEGANYYVSTTEDSETKTLMQKYRLITKTSEYVIIQLK